VARNKHPGTCYRCSKRVEIGDGHFERCRGTRGGWRVQHATCAIEHRAKIGRPKPAPTGEPIPDYADLMTLEEFAAGCRCTAYTAYDGHGYYATTERMSAIRVVPARIASGEIEPGFTHVAWFNK
jgi:hypothetical protein